MSHTNGDCLTFKPLSLGILMLIYTGIVFFSTMLVYYLMLIASFIVLVIMLKKRALGFGIFFTVLLAISFVLARGYIHTEWIGAYYTMCLIVLKLFPIWILASILSNYSTSAMIYTLRQLHLSQNICIGVAIFFRFLPEYRAYLSEIKEGLKVRGIKASLAKPIHSLEILIVPMIYKAFETSEILSCALITKGIEYDCKKTSYIDLAFTWRDYVLIAVGIIFLGITLWQKLLQ